MQHFISEVMEIFEKNSQRTFLIEDSTGRQFTYDQFYSLAGEAANQMIERGVHQQQRVALLLNNSAEFAAFYFACLFLGAIAVPINPSLHPEEISFILSHSDVCLVVCSPLTKKLLERTERGIREPVFHLLPLCEVDKDVDHTVDWVRLGDSPARFSDREFFQSAGDEDLFSITFTSGTTSMPKGVAHRVSSLLGNAKAFDSLLDITAENRFLHALPMAYMAGFLNDLLCPFMAGGSILLMPPFDARMAINFWAPVIRHSVDTFWMVPTMLNSILKLDRGDEGVRYCRESVKTICTCTAPLPLKTKRDFEDKYGVEVFNSYGLSELLIITCASKKHVHRSENSVGWCLPENEVRIVDANGNPLADGVDGEIHIKTPYSMVGYLNYDTLMPDEIDPSGWFSTGDAGHLDQHGQVFITGREKDLIVRGGINVSPRSVEDVLLENQAVEQVAVVGFPHEFYGEEVAAVLVLKPAYSLDDIRSSLDKTCKDKLNTYSVPTRYFVMDQFPTSSNGKVQKNILKKMIIEKSGFEN